jgi:hypothetical protein
MSGTGHSVRSGRPRTFKEARERFGAEPQALAGQTSSECQSSLNGSPIASNGAVPALLRISSAKSSASSAFGALMLIA